MQVPFRTKVKLPHSLHISFRASGLNASSDRLLLSRQGAAVCTENLIRVDDVMESPKLAK